MKLFQVIKLTLSNLRGAFILCIGMVLCVVAAQGLQHCVEYYLGMYESVAAFKAKQSSPMRLSFGILKAVSLITACYVIPKHLSATYGPPPQFGSFRADMIRKLWDPRLGFTGIIAMNCLVAPLVYVHIKLNYVAMGHDLAPILLIADSVLIGSLALVMGTSVWASDTVEHQHRMTT